MANLRKQIYDSIINLLPQGRKNELKKTLNITYAGIEALKQKKIEVENALRVPQEIPVDLSLDTSKKMFGVEVYIEYIKKDLLPDTLLNKEPEPILPTASSLAKRNYNRRYNYWIKSVKEFLRNQPVRYGKTLLSGARRILPPIPIEERTFRFSVNRGKINKSVEAFKESFIEDKGGEVYCLIITFIKTETDQILNRSFMDVPITYTNKKLNFFNKEGAFIVDNSDKGDGLCVPNLIQKEIFPKKSIDKIIDDMEEAYKNDNSIVKISYSPFPCDGDDEGLNIRKNGITLHQLEPYCKKYRIYMKVFDVDETLLYQCKPDVIDKHKTILMFILHDGHPYSIINVVKRLELTNQKTKVLLRKEIANKKKEEEEEFIPKHSKYIPDAPYDFENYVGDLYCDRYEDIRDLFVYLYLSKGLIPKYKNDGENIIRISVNPNCNLIYNKEYDVYKNLEDFDNHTSSKLAYKEMKDFNIDNLKSTFNKNSLDFCNLTHSYATTKQFNSVNDINNCVQYDINKQYAHLLETIDMWFVVGNKEDIQQYDGNTIFDDCLYYVEPSEFNPLMYSNGVYYPKLVKEALTDKLIKKTDIKYFLTCNQVRTKVFKEFVKNVYNNPKYENCSKNIVNHYVGSLGRRNKTIGKLIFGEDINTMYCNYFTNDDLQYAYKYAEYNGKKLFITSSVKTIDNNNSLFMIRNQIIQYGNLQSYQLSKRVGGKLIKIATDSILMENPVNVLELSDARGGLKLEKPKQLGGVDNKVDNKKVFEYNDFILNVIDIKDEYDFEEIYEKTKGKCFFLTGQGGTGKSCISNKYIERLEEEGKIIRKCAPTHIAGKSIGGMTCHKSFGYDITKKTHISNYSSVDYIIIDEISMCDAKFYDEMNYIKKNNPNVIFICFGDFNQLPPVKHTGKQFLYYTMFKHIFENIIQLKINKRCGEEAEKMFNLVLEILDEKRVETNTSLVHRNFKQAEYQEELNLCYTNKRRKEINAHCMNIFKPDDAKFIKYEEDKPEESEEENPEENDEEIKQDKEETIYGQDTYIYKGLPLRSKKTYQTGKKGDLNIVNGDQFIVVDYDDEEVLLFKDNSRFPNYNPNEVEEFTIKFSKNFLKYFIPNYAMTIHSSQCQSFNQPYILHEVEKYDNYLLNVAVSRTRKLEYVKYV
jgi:GTPase SAR1 family protein